jgi:hypothetical protein
VTDLSALAIRSSWTIHRGIIYYGVDVTPVVEPTRMDIERWRGRGRRRRRAERRHSNPNSHPKEI